MCGLLDDRPSSASASPDLSREGPFDARLDTSATGEVPLVLDSLPGCQYRMISYDLTEVADVDPAHRLQLHHPLFLEYVGAPESACLLSSPLQLLGQFVTSLNRISSEVKWLAFGQEQFPSVVNQAISPLPRVRRAAHYMAAMGLWRPPGGPGAPGPVPTSSCNNCMRCANCFMVMDK